MILVNMIVSVTTITGEKEKNNKRCGPVKRRTAVRVLLPVVFFAFVVIFAIVYSIPV